VTCSLKWQCAEAEACSPQQQQPPRSPPDWQRRPTWASDWAAQHALQSAGTRQGAGSDFGGGGGGGSSASDALDVTGVGGLHCGGPSSGGDTPMRSMAYLQQQEWRYISAGI
jgi:hypothetical protein